MSIAIIMGSAKARLEFLRANQNADGGWGYFPGLESRVEASCYALRAIGATDERWGAGIAYLSARQDKSGGLAPSASVPGATWVTSLAFPLLREGGASQKSLEAAADWILDSEGAEGGMMQRLLYSLGKSKVDQDPRLKGWPWRPDNNSWVEPTAHGLLALQWMDGLGSEAGRRYRGEMATKMLLDRRCEDGGWNYGNKKVLGEVLPAFPETTGLALIGLVRSGLDLGVSIAKAKQDYSQTKGCYGKALLAIALRLHGERVSYTPEHAAGHPSRNLMLAAIEALAESGGKEAFLP